MAIEPGLHSLDTMLVTEALAFARACGRCFDAIPDLVCVAQGTHGEALGALRRDSPQHVFLDIDHQNPAQVISLCRKMRILRPVGITLLSGYLGLGTVGLGTILQAISADLVMKPGGVSSLGLIAEDQSDFSRRLRASCGLGGEY
jgi:ActR/RegA family two-component response regulator